MNLHNKRIHAFFVWFKKSCIFAEYIIHTMGKKEKSETTFTRYEFEKQLNCLKEFLKKESN